MAPGVPTKLLNSDNQPNKTMRPSSSADEDSDIEMTSPSSDDTMPQLQFPENTGVTSGEQDAAEGTSTGPSTADNVSSAATGGRNVQDSGVFGLPWTDAPGWGFPVAAAFDNTDGDSNDPGMTGARQFANDLDADAPHHNPTALPHDEIPVGGAVPPNADPDIPNGAASDNEQAINNAVAEDVAAETAAADQANTQDWLAAQNRWLTQLANDNPEEFARLVESGIIDEDFVPERLAQQGNGNGNTDGPATNDNANHAATNVDGQVDDTIEEEGDDQDEAIAPPQPTVAPAQPATDGNAAPNNPVPNTDHFVWLANRADASDENAMCPACQTEFDPDETIIYLDCGHAWCSDCLNANYRSALKNRAQWPPRCCNIGIGHESIAYLLDDEVQLELAMKMDEFADRNPIFCQTPKCEGGYIGVERRDGQWASCMVCRLSTCVECRAPASAHPMPAMHPNMIAQLDKELADGQGWKQCPGCRNVVERTMGCNFMSCECGHEFCYQCGKTLENNMPCDCMGQQQWVADMNNEAAGGRSDDEDSESDTEDEDERELREEREERERQELHERAEADADAAAARVAVAGAAGATAVAGVDRGAAAAADTALTAAAADAEEDDREDDTDRLAPRQVDRMQ